MALNNEFFSTLAFFLSTLKCNLTCQHHSLQRLNVFWQVTGIKYQHALKPNVTHLRRKYFYAVDTVGHQLAQIDMNDEAFEIYAARTNLTNEVSSKEVIFSALKRAGIKVDTSCENGLCVSCLTDVLQGKPEYRDLVLTDAEKAANNCTAACCSRSQSRRLVLDV